MFLGVNINFEITVRDQYDWSSVEEIQVVEEVESNFQVKDTMFARLGPGWSSYDPYPDDISSEVTLATDSGFSIVNCSHEGRSYNSVMNQYQQNYIKWEHVIIIKNANNIKYLFPRKSLPSTSGWHEFKLTCIYKQE